MDQKGARVGDKDVPKYERRRYAGLDQWLVNRREQALVRRILDEIGFKGRILDAPCGFGRFSEALSAVSPMVVSADVSHAMVSRARERIGRKGAFVVMDIRHLPFKDNALDGTFTMRLFHHGFAREQMGGILKELARVSRCFVILSYYENTGLHALLRKLKGFKSRIKMMGEAEFQAHAARAGLVVRSRYRLARWLHAQVLVALEKS